MGQYEVGLYLTDVLFDQCMLRTSEGAVLRCDKNGLMLCRTTHISPCPAYTESLV